ncbi:hypothetical protein BS47DRAFT_987216 [Hydnum rufescens UP504]|uniref:Inactive metallocarboxypeptidase ECM14 n=1 Tax=Hydnum rufescens UP504 TaxID=1448309 RepID=A0A9P6AW95_9AGAM|nr:hypothetical protein BS47DRAFT_987216 [Hydnum rufescens UP504]
MNRNWGYQWKNSSDPCHHCATPNIRGFIDLRSYGQLLMYPFAHTCSVLPAHAEDLIEAALGASKATKEVHGTKMRTGAACELLYHAPGSVLDWAYATAGISFSYSVALRDTGTYGFLLPTRWIRPVGEETGALIEYLANWIFKRKL